MFRKSWFYSSLVTFLLPMANDPLEKNVQNRGTIRCIGENSHDSFVDFYDVKRPYRTALNKCPFSHQKDVADTVIVAATTSATPGGEQTFPMLLLMFPCEPSQPTNRWSSQQISKQASKQASKKTDRQPSNTRPTQPACDNNGCTNQQSSGRRRRRRRRAGAVVSR